MTADEEGLSEDLLALASDLRMRSDNLLSAEWHEAWGDLPTLRERQYGMAIESRCVADALVQLLGIDPASLWGEKSTPPRLPPSERSQIAWSDGVNR